MQDALAGLQQGKSDAVHPAHPAAHPTRSLAFAADEDIVGSSHVQQVDLAAAQRCRCALNFLVVVHPLDWGGTVPSTAASAAPNRAAAIRHLSNAAEVRPAS